MSVYRKVTKAKVNGQMVVRFADETGNEAMRLGDIVSMGQGTIQLRHNGQFEIIRRSKDGDVTYRIVLEREGDYLLGPNHGLFLLPWREEQDPLKRLLRRLEIPFGHVSSMAKNSPLTIFEKDGNHWDRFSWSSSFLTDGTKVLSGGEEAERQGNIAAATYAVQVKECGGSSGDTHRRKFIGHIYLWPGCDLSVLASVLADVKYGEHNEPTDAGFLDALDYFDAAQKWVATHYTISSHAQGDRLSVTVAGLDYDRDFRILKMEYGDQVGPLRLLVQRYGATLLSPYFGQEQEAFLDAHADQTEAAKFIFARYNVVGVARGEERHLKFAYLGTPDQFGDLDSPRLPGAPGNGCDQALRVLLEVHPVLSSLLFVQAKAKNELVAAYKQSKHRGLKFEGGVWWTVDVFSAKSQPICLQDEAVKVWLHARPGTTYYEDNLPVVVPEGMTIDEHLVCLSASRRGRLADVQPQDGRHITDVLVEGDRAILGSGFNALLLIKPGETKRFVFHIAHAWGSSMGYSIWGLVAARSADGEVTFSPYENGQLYSCSGFNGQEVRRIVTT
jgi:hypothetical protein